MGKKITSIDYNWYFSQQDGGVETATVGHRGCVEIEEHQPRGEGDRWYYDIHFDTGVTKRVFNPNMVTFEPTTTI